MAYDDREQSLQGADYTYVATVSCSASDPLVLAILTWKANLADADPGILQKKVTTSNVAGTGQITADGSANGLATIRFDIADTDTTALSPRDMIFDVKVKTNSGAIAYGAGGIWHLFANVTTAIS